MCPERNASVAWDMGKERWCPAGWCVLVEEMASDTGGHLEETMGFGCLETQSVGGG